MAADYNRNGCGEKANYYTHLKHYVISATIQCNKWWKKLNNGLWDISCTNAMISWTQVKKNRKHGPFIDNLIHQYVNNRLDEGYSWKEMRTGIPDAEKGVTKFSAALRKKLVDNLVAGKKIRAQMLKEMSLKPCNQIT
jgi:hypothetical protein